MIVARELSKKYGEQVAVDRISFEAEGGKIVGLLGPNGAGKSTTMRLLSGFIPPSGGQAFVAGHDVVKDSLRARECIGYLPEHNPLYPGMYVREYLRFMASLHGLRRSRKEVEDVIERTGLGPESHKRLGQLSKGYRQRAGLAQAILHDPPVLILDEPTSGLDPNQLLHMRRLILELGREKTILLSTHIMQEVEFLCQDVLIISRGRIVARDSLAELTRGRQLEDVFRELTT